MERPCQVSFSTSSRYRLPSLTLQSRRTSSRNDSSTSRKPPALACRAGTLGVEAEERRQDPVDHEAGGDVPNRIDRLSGELRQPPASVRAERLDELALRLGTDRVEHERRLAAAAHAGESHEPVLRKRPTSMPLRLFVRAPRISMEVIEHLLPSPLHWSSYVSRRSAPSSAALTTRGPVRRRRDRRLSGPGVVAPGRRSSDGLCVPGALLFWSAALIFRVAAAAPVAQPRALWERQRIAQAAGLTPGIGRGERGRTGG